MLNLKISSKLPLLRTLIKIYLERASVFLIKSKEVQGIKAKSYIRTSIASVNENFLSDKLQISSAEKIKMEYAQALKAALGDIASNCVIDYHAELNEEMKNSIVYTEEILSFIKMKSSEAQLMVNVSSVNILFKPILGKNKIELSLEYELKSNGRVWATIFSRFVSKKIMENMNVLDCTVSTIHCHNITRGREIFTLLVTHDIAPFGFSFLNVKSIQTSSLDTASI